VLGEPAQKVIEVHLADLLKAGQISDYDAVIGRRIAYVLSGGDVPAGSEVDEKAMLWLEEDAFHGLLKEQRTLDRISHMRKTGKRLKN
jgi:3-hydroxyacyl-CoA dehydrogenase